MTNYLSRKITFFHIFGVLLVLPIHAFFPYTESFGILRHLFILFCRSFQPIYFGLAGYLFFINIQGGGKIKHKLQNRIWTLLIPYLFWNVFVTILMTIFVSANIDSPIILKFEYNIEHITLIKQLKYIFWGPIAGHLWFIRDLILVSLLSWPLFMLLRNNKWFTLVVLGCIALATTQSQTASLFSFAVGGYLSINKINIQKIKKSILILAGIVFLCMLILFTCIRVEHNAIPLMSWSTAILLWYLYDKIIPEYSMLNLSSWRSFFFFIYLFHDPWLNIICTYMSKSLPNNFTSNLFTFIVSQIVIISISLIIAKFLAVYCPRFYALITGNRKK